MHAGRNCKLVFISIFFLGCGTSQSFNQKVEQEGTVWLESVSYEKSSEAGFFDGRFIGEWLFQDLEQTSDVALKSRCGFEEGKVKAISVPYRTGSVQFAKRPCAGRYNLHFIQSPEISIEIVEHILSNYNEAYVSASVEPFVTKVGDFEIEVSKLGSFAREQRMPPAMTHPGLENLSFGKISTPFYLVLTNPKGDPIFVAKIRSQAP